MILTNITLKKSDFLISSYFDRQKYRFNVFQNEKTYKSSQKHSFSSLSAIRMYTKLTYQNNPLFFCYRSVGTSNARLYRFNHVQPASIFHIYWNSSRTILCPSKSSLFFSRNMHRASSTVKPSASHGLANSAYHNLTRTNHTPYIHKPSGTRSMTCFHGGRLKKNAIKPLVQHTDLSGKHALITKTTCSKPNCEQVNCANANNPNQVNPCGRSISQNLTAIPPTAQGYKSEIIGNTTTQEPYGVPGREINSQTNYSGKSAPQRMVEEKPPVPVDSKDVQIDTKVTKFVQEHNNHLEINK